MRILMDELSMELELSASLSCDDGGDDDGDDESAPLNHGLTWKKNETPSLETGLNLLHASEKKVDQQVLRLQETLSLYERQIAALKQKILLISLESEKRVRAQVAHFHDSQQELEEKIHILRNELKEAKNLRQLQMTQLLSLNALRERNESVNSVEDRDEMQDSIMGMSSQQLTEMVRVLRQQVIIYVQDFNQEREARTTEKGKQDKLREEILMLKREAEIDQVKLMKLEGENQSLRKDRAYLKYRINQYQEDIASLKRDQINLQHDISPVRNESHQKGVLWPCKICTFHNASKDHACHLCGQLRNEKGISWICQACSHKNQFVLICCENCGHRQCPS